MDNSISLQSLVFEYNEVVYINIHYGANIKYSIFCSTYNGKVIVWKEIKLEQMKGRCLLVTISKQEFLKLFKDILIMDTSNVDLNFELISGIIV